MVKYQSKYKNKYMRHYKKEQSDIKRNLLIAACGLVVVMGILFILEKKDVTNLFTARNTATTDDDAKTTSTAPTAQEDFTDGGPRDVGESSDNEGRLEDTNGTIPTTPPQSQWT